MRTANEIELFPMAQDLIDIVSLSKVFAAQYGLTLGEACELVTSAVIHCGEIVEVYRTDEPGMPTCVSELNGKFDVGQPSSVIWMPFNSRWWESPCNLSAIQPEWGGTPESLAIRRTDAQRLLDITLQDQLPQVELPTKTQSKRKRKHYLDHVIRRARNQCPDPEDVDSVWPELTRMARSKFGVLLGVTETGIQYADANDKGKEFSKKSLEAYLTGRNLDRKRPPKSA